MTIRFEELSRSAAALFGLCAITAAGLTASCFSERTAGTSNTCDGTTTSCVVDIRNFSFQPATLRVTAGTTVTWVNGEQQAGLSHTSTSDGAGWDSGSLAPGASFSRTFTATGQFPYHCEPHPNMRGTVIVE